MCVCVGYDNYDNLQLTVVICCHQILAEASGDVFHVSQQSGHVMPLRRLTRHTSCATQQVWSSESFCWLPDFWEKQRSRSFISDSCNHPQSLLVFACPCWSMLPVGPPQHHHRHHHEPQMHHRRPFLSRRIAYARSTEESSRRFRDPQALWNKDACLLVFLSARSFDTIRYLSSFLRMVGHVWCY